MPLRPAHAHSCYSFVEQSLPISTTNAGYLGVARTANAYAKNNTHQHTCLCYSSPCISVRHSVHSQKHGKRGGRSPCVACVGCRGLRPCPAAPAPKQQAHNHTPSRFLLKEYAPFSSEFMTTTLGVGIAVHTGDTSSRAPLPPQSYAMHVHVPCPLPDAESHRTGRDLTRRTPPQRGENIPSFPTCPAPIHDLARRRPTQHLQHREGSRPTHHAPRPSSAQ